VEFKYYIDMDERGEFRADVRDENDNTVWETEGFEIFEDGFMKHKEDLSGLTKYLKSLDIMKFNDILTEGN
jgi:hypothetical protein